MNDAEIIYDLQTRVRAAEAKAATQKAVRDIAVAARDGERRKAHTEKLKSIARAAVNEKRAGPATMTHFTTRFGADNSDAIMGFTSNDVVEWLKSCAPTDKTMQQAMVTRGGSRFAEADATGGRAVPDEFAFSALTDEIAAERGYTRAQRQSAAVELEIVQLARARDPDLYRRHVEGAWG